MRQELPDRRVGLRAAAVEPRDAIVEIQTPFLDASQRERRGEHLGETIEMKGRVGTGRNRSLDILQAETALPEDAVFADEGGGKARNARLPAQRFEIVLEQPEQQRVAAERHTGRQERDREDEQNPAH